MFKYIAHNFMTRRQRRAFSLIEVIIGIALISFVSVAFLGLFQTGMIVFHDAIDISVRSQIAERLVNDVQQASFDVLTTDIQSAGPYSSNYTFLQVVPNTNRTTRYFDDQGNEMNTWAGAVYQTNIRITPVTLLPQTQGVYGNVNLATVTIQVAYNPSHQPLAFEPGAADNVNAPTRNLWNGAIQSNPQAKVVSIFSYTTLISRN